LAKSIELYEQALKIDSDNARTWAGLGRSYGFYAGYGFMDHKEGAKKSQAAAEKALALDPNEPRAHEGMGWVRFAYQFKWEEAGLHFRKAHQLAPNDSRILTGLSNFEGAMGNMDEALRLSRMAVDLEPLSAHAHLNLGKFHWWSGQHLEARACFEKALELSPDYTLGHAFVAVTYMELGDYDRAIEEAQKERTKGYRVMALSRIYHAAGRDEDSKKALEELIACGEEWAIQIVLCHAGRNELDQAFHWLDRAFELHDTGMVIIKIHPHFENLRSDPRYAEFLDKIGLTA